MKLICLEFSDRHWIEVIRQVATKRPISVAYWTGTVARQAEVNRHFPSAIFHDNLLAARGLPPTGWYPDGMIPVDACLIAKLEPYQLTAMKMMERMDPDRASFSFENRLRHYFRLVEYWVAVFEQLRPDAVLMPISPHLVFDYVAYAICQVLGIPTLFFDRTGIPGCVLPVNSIVGGGDDLRERYQALLAMESVRPLSEGHQSYLGKLQGDFSVGMAPNFRLKMDRYSLAPSTGGGIQRPSALRILRYEAKGVLAHVRTQALRAPRNYYVRRGQPPEARRVGFLGFHLLRWSGIFRKSRLNRLYERLQIDERPDSPYVFVALHYQPERNTVPSGGIFADQLLIVKLLAACLPVGWQVLVKEHNWQLQPFSRGQSSRDEVFYRDLVSIPGVKLVPMSMPSFELIDGASAVATVAGSVGWEAINRGKPALVFGEAWYQYCDGVYRIVDIHDCRHAIQRIQGGARPDQERIRRFVAAVEDVAINAVLEPRQEDSGGISPEMNIQALADSFLERLNCLVPGCEAVVSEAAMLRHAKVSPLAVLNMPDSNNDAQ